MRFRYTLHADNVLQKRGIERLWVERTVLAPQWTEADPVDPNLTRAFAAVPERDGRMLRVVYSHESDGYRVVTAFLDRGARR
jgi:hypothetical protein